MKKYIVAAVALVSICCVSCRKKTEQPDEYATTDTTGVLKQVAEFPIGVGVRPEWMAGDQQYASIVKTHFNSITLENDLKHATIVSNEGAYDYSKADAALAMSDLAGFAIHGHALVDFQSSNATYLRSLTSNTTTVNAVPNPGFENGTGNNFSNWVTQVDPSANGGFSADVSTPYAGARAMKVMVAAPGQYQYSIQAYSDLFPVTAGNVYSFTFYARADVIGSKFKAVVQNTTYQEKTFFLTQNWEQYTFTFTANEPSLTIRLHFPSAGTFYFDELSMLKPASGDNAVDPVKLDNAMKQFITSTINRYKSRIHSWDVVNEPFADGGALRSASQAGASTSNFYYADYLGKDYIAKAFQYANAADPSAVLYINEDKLESDEGKLNAMVGLVNDLKAQQVPVHGIGIQMHLTTKSDRKAIETALIRLAATGLKIRISEMDVRVNPWNYFGFNASDEDLVAQRDLYRFVVGAYYRLVPAAQRAGITFWDPVDKYSWIIVNQNKEDAPTLFNSNYGKKPAYYGVIVGLRKKE